MLSSAARFISLEKGARSSAFMAGSSHWSSLGNGGRAFCGAHRNSHAVLVKRTRKLSSVPILSQMAWPWSSLPARWESERMPARREGLSRRGLLGTGQHHSSSRLSLRHQMKRVRSVDAMTMPARTIVWSTTVGSGGGASVRST